MCELLSGWINLDTEEPELADLRSHSESQRLLGWTTKDLVRRREWEWTKDDDGESLVVRTGPDDPPELAGFLRAALLTKWPTRGDALRGAVAMLPDSVTWLDLCGVTIPEGFVVPSSVTWLGLSGATIPEGFVVPDSVTTLHLSGVTIPEGFVVPDSVTTLDLYYATIPKGFVIPPNTKVYR